MPAREIFRIKRVPREISPRQRGPLLAAHPRFSKRPNARKGLDAQTTEAVRARDDAIKALQEIHPAAVESDNRRRSAEREAAEQRAIDARANAAGEIAQLKAEKQLLAERDRHARDELDALRLTR